MLFNYASVDIIIYIAVSSEEEEEKEMEGGRDVQYIHRVTKIVKHN